MTKPQGPPLVARVVRWAMYQRRRGIRVPDGVLALLVVLAERTNISEGCARPGNATLFLDTDIASKDRMRRTLRKGAALGAVSVKPGRGRGHATEVRFTDSVWNAPGLDKLAQLDTEKRARNTASIPASEKGALATGKGRIGDRERARSCAPPTVNYREATDPRPYIPPASAGGNGHERFVREAVNRAVDYSAGQGVFCFRPIRRRIRDWLKGGMPLADVMKRIDAREHIPEVPR